MAESNLVIVGVNHKTTPVELREKLAFTRGNIEESTEKLGSFPEIDENLIISTCNRVEIYARVSDVDKGIDRLKKFICDFHLIPYNLLDKHFTPSGNRKRYNTCSGCLPVSIPWWSGNRRFWGR